MADTTLCSRCGDKLPDGPARVLLERPFCQSCLKLPGVDFIAETRRRCLGKRDGYVWLMGGLWLLTSLTQLSWLVSSTMSLGPSARFTLMAIYGVGALLSVATLVRWRPVRTIWVVDTLLGLIALGYVLDSVGPGDQGLLVFPAIASFVIACAAYASDRNRLAFGIDITDERMLQLYLRHLDNRAAKFGRALAWLSIPAAGIGASFFAEWSIAALLLGLLCLPALVLSWLGLQRVDPEAWPPVGRRGRAVWGIAVSLLSLLLFLGSLVLRLVP